MSTHVVEIHDALADLVLRPIADKLGVKHIDFADPYLVGPELGNRVKRLGPQDGLNCIVVSPMPPQDDPADAAKQTKRVEYPLDIYFIFRREGAELRDIVQRYVNPLHDELEKIQLQRLGNLKLYNARGRQVGHVVNFGVGEPNLFPPDNDDLYPFGLAAFTIGVQVNYIRVCDPDTNSGG